MDLTWTTEERAFRQEVQDFVHAKLPAALRAKAFAHHRVTREEFVFWHNTLTDHGWGGAELAQRIRWYRLESGAAPDF